jgi:hypothetical protein
MTAWSRVASLARFSLARTGARGAASGAVLATALGAAVLGATALGAASLAGCVHRAGGAAGASDSTTVVNLPVYLTVESHARVNVVLFVVRGGIRHRLGTVVAASTQRFEMPRDAIRDPAGFSLLGEPIGGDPPGHTDLLHVLPGQRIVWTLEANLTRSSVAVYQ